MTANPVNGLGNATAADLVSRAAPSSAAHRGFEAVISDRGVDMAAAAGRSAIAAPRPAGIESSSAAETQSLSVDRASASQATAPVNGPSMAAAPERQSTEAGNLTGIAVSSEVAEQAPAGTYNARGRLASPTQAAPQSRLLDITG